MLMDLLNLLLLGFSAGVGYAIGVRVVGKL